MRRWSNSSWDKLSRVHPDIIKGMNVALQESPIDFRVIEGLRTLARQKQLVASGASTTLRSRHLTGHAVDIVPLVNGVVRWDWPLYHRMAPAIKLAFKSVGVPIEWGGNWRSFPDGPHWQLPWDKYPA